MKVAACDLGHVVILMLAAGGLALFLHEVSVARHTILPIWNQIAREFGLRPVGWYEFRLLSGRGTRRGFGIEMFWQKDELPAHLRWGWAIPNLHLRITGAGIHYHREQIRDLAESNPYVTFAKIHLDSVEIVFDKHRTQRALNFGNLPIVALADSIIDLATSGEVCAGPGSFGR